MTVEGYVIEPPDDYSAELALVEDDGDSNLRAGWDEMALLGSAMQGYRGLADLLHVVSAEDFANPQHGNIWSAIVKVHNRGDVPTPVLVMHELGAEAQRLPGGAIYLANLLNPGMVIAAQAPQYAAHVREASVWRQVDGFGVRCRQAAQDVDMSVQEFLPVARQWFDGIEMTNRKELSDTATALREAIDVAEHGESLATPTPWSDLNELVRGWYPNRLTIVGARPGVGKSIFLENAATDMARNQGMEVLWISLEMSRKELMQRTLSWTARVDLAKLIEGGMALDDRDWEAISTATSVINGQKYITYADRQGQSLADIQAATHVAAQAAKRRGERLGLVCIDYAQLIYVQMRGSMTRQQAMGEVSRGLKALAKQHECQVLCAAQLNRGLESRQSKRPVMSDLRETGDFEQDADCVILLHEVEVEDGDQMVKTGDVDLIVDKQRSGPTGVRTVGKYGYLAKFR